MLRWNVAIILPGLQESRMGIERVKLASCEQLIHNHITSFFNTVLLFTCVPMSFKLVLNSTLGIKMATFWQQVLKPLGSYTWVFAVGFSGPISWKYWTSNKTSWFRRWLLSCLSRGYKSQANIAHIQDLRLIGEARIRTDNFNFGCARQLNIDM